MIRTDVYSVPIQLSHMTCMSNTCAALVAPCVETDASEYGEESDSDSEPYLLAVVHDIVNDISKRLALD